MYYAKGDWEEGRMTDRKVWASALFAALSLHMQAQTATDMAALKGLAPVTVLSNTAAGEAARVLVLAAKTRVERLSALRSPS